MPTPIEILLDPISLGVLALYGALMLWEAIAPGRKLPKIKGWIPRALGSFAVYFYLSSYLPLVWDGYLAQYQLFDLSGLGTLAGAAIGLALCFGQDAPDAALDPLVELIDGSRHDMVDYYPWQRPLRGLVHVAIHSMGLTT